jgi:predicted DNA-binding transcriptional regulator AlpA
MLLGGPPLQTDTDADLPPPPPRPTSQFLRTPDAAIVLGLSPRTLEKHRTYGTGPTYRKLGGRVVYRLDDLRAWSDRGLRTSTTDPGQGTVYAARPLNAAERAEVVRR